MHDVYGNTLEMMQDEGRKTAASTYLIDPTLPDYGKSSLEMQVHQGTLNRRSQHMPSIMSMDSPPQRTTASGTLSGGSPICNATSTDTTDTSRTDSLMPRCPKASQDLTYIALLVSSHRNAGQIHFVFFYTRAFFCFFSFFFLFIFQWFFCLFWHDCWKLSTQWNHATEHK